MVKAIICKKLTKMSNNKWKNPTFIVKCTRDRFYLMKTMLVN